MNCECGWCWGLSWESHIRRGGSASLRAEGSRLHLVLFNSDIGLELDAENEFGGHGLDAVRNFSDLVHALLDERGEFLGRLPRSKFLTVRSADPVTSCPASVGLNWRQETPPPWPFDSVRRSAFFASSAPENFAVTTPNPVAST